MTLPWPRLTLLLFLSFAPCTWLWATSMETAKTPEIYLIKDTSYPVVSVTMILKNAGLLQDTPGQEGRTVLSIFMLIRYMQINREALKREGVLYFNAEANKNHTAITILAQKDQLDSALRAIIKTLYTVELSYPEWRAQKTTVKQSFLDPELSVPEQFLSYKWSMMHFPNHPIGKRFGTSESIDSLNPNDFKYFWEERVRRDNIIFMVAGDTTVAKFRRLIIPILDQLPEGGMKAPESTPATYPDETPSLQVFQLDKPQSHVVFSHKGLPRDHPDFYTLQVLNHIIGGGSFTSRLWKILREENGLVYSVNTTVQESLSAILGFFSTDNTSVMAVAHHIRTVIDEIQKNGVTEEEVAIAKNQLIGQSLLPTISLEGTTEAMQMAFEKEIPISEFMTYTSDRLNKVTLADVNRLAKTLLKPDSLKYIIVGNPEISNT